MDQRSPVHEIVNALWRALHGLGAPADTNQVERWGFAIHAALSAAGREFHNHDHVIDIAKHGDPLEVIAALYHDAVYIQVDQGPPHSMRAEMDRVLGAVDKGWRVLPGAADDPATADVLAVLVGAGYPVRVGSDLHFGTSVARDSSVAPSRARKGAPMCRVRMGLLWPDSYSE